MKVKTGEIVLADGTVAVEGQGRYLKMVLDSITDFDFAGLEWRITENADDALEFDLP